MYRQLTTQNNSESLGFSVLKTLANSQEQLFMRRNLTRHERKATNAFIIHRKNYEALKASASGREEWGLTRVPVEERGSLTAAFTTLVAFEYFPVGFLFQSTSFTFKNANRELWVGLVFQSVV